MAEVRILEKSKVDNILPLYIWVEVNGNYAMQAFGQVLTFHSSYLSTLTNQSWLQLCCKNTINFLQMKLLVIGHLFRHDGVHYHFSNTVKNKQQLFKSVIDQLQEQVKHQAIFLKDLPTEYSLPFKINPRFTAFDNDVSMQLALPENWQSIDDYQAALKKKYAKRMRTTQKLFADVQIKELSLEEVENQQLEIYALYEQVVKNQSVTFGKINQQYFPLFKKQMKEKLLMYGFYYKEKLVAFSSAIVQHGVYDMNYIGFDYETNNSISLYHNLLFFFIKDAIDKKQKTLVLGRTALEAKAILGCKPVPIMGYYKIKNRMLAAVTNQFTRRTAKQQGNMWLNRHPFKTDVAEDAGE